MQRTPLNFAAMLDPYSPERFFGSIWGKTHLHVRGEKGKFTSLLPWSSLNEILAAHRLDHPRIRLIKDGSEISTADVIQRWRSKENVMIPDINPSALNQMLRDGCTLLIESIEEMCAPLRTVTENLEYELREDVQVNAYAGWGDTRGFHVHRDNHDVYITQVAGRKHWRIYGPSERLPEDADANPHPAPPKDAIWEGVLEDGDFLYIPRGWWHDAIGKDGLTLHLTFGVVHRNGFHLLKWLAEDLKTREPFQSDLPRFASPAQQAVHMERLRNEWMALWDAGLLERFFQHCDGKAIPRPRFTLPWSAEPQLFPPGDGVRFRLTVPRPVEFSIASDSNCCEFLANGRKWRFPAHARIVLRSLLERGTCTISEICEDAYGEMNGSLVKMLLSAFMLQGLVTTVDSE